MKTKIIFFIQLSLLVFNLEAAPSVPRAVNGVIDLSNYNFETREAVKLSGDWRFFWKKFINPSLSDKEKIFNEGENIQVPGSWTQLKKTKKKTQGYATYILKLKGIKKGEELGIIAGRIFSNYNLFLIQNKKVKKIFSSGITGPSKKSSTPQLLKGKNSFTSEGNDILLVLHVSNYHYREGKVFLDFKIGKKEKVFREFSKSEYRKYFYVGWLFILCLYHISIFIKRPKNKEPLYFSLFCGFILIRQVTVAHDFFWIYGVPSTFLFELNAKLDYFTLIYSFPVFVSFVYSLYPSKMMTFHKYIYLPPILFTPIIVFFPAEVFSKTYFLITAQLFVLIGCSILFILTFLLAYKKERFARLLFISMNFLIFGAVYDILIQQGYLPAPQILTPMLVLFSFAQSYIIAVNFSTAFDKSEKLSEELFNLNKDLDLKVQKRTAQLKKVQEERSLFFSKLSHELKTPLNVILGFSNFIIDSMNKAYLEKNRKKYLEYLDSIRSSGKSLLSLVNEIHDFTKLDLSRLQIFKKPMDLNFSLKNISNFYFHKCQEKGIVYSSAQKTLDNLIHFDELRLKQILDNFLTNGLKFTSKGSLELSFDYKYSDKSQQFIDIHFRIKDTGIGIKEEKIPNLFETFSQTHELTTFEERGTGLGLHISKKIIEVLGGSVEVQSVFGKGTQFDIYFPRVKIVIEKNLDYDLTDDYTFFGDKILIADDFPANLSLLETLFTDANLKIVTAKNGEELYEKAIKHQPSLIITDFSMPKGDGLTIKNHLKKNDKTKDIPIILLTAFNIDTKTRKEFDAVLFKPVEKSDIFEICSRFLRNKSHKNIETDKETFNSSNFYIPENCGKIEFIYLQDIKRHFQNYLELQNITDLETYCIKLEEKLADTKLKNLTPWLEQVLVETEKFNMEQIKVNLKEAIIEINKYLEEK